jgi:hypothetical protein
LPIGFAWIGYSTSGIPCSFPPPYRPGATASDTESSRGWWEGLFTLSASNRDPFDNQGRLPLDAVLYLWIADAGCGYGFADAGVHLYGDMPVSSYTPIAAGFHTWTPSVDPRRSTLKVSLDCARDPTLVGKFSLSRRRSEPFDEARPSWGLVKSKWRRAQTNPAP